VAFQFGAKFHNIM